MTVTMTKHSESIYHDTNSNTLTDSYNQNVSLNTYCSRNITYDMTYCLKLNVQITGERVTLHIYILSIACMNIMCIEELAVYYKK